MFMRLDIEGIIRYKEFLLEGLEAVCCTSHKRWNPKVFISFLADGFQKGVTAAWVELVKGVPVGMYVLAENPKGCVEVVAVYNYPSAHPKEGLRTEGIEWAKSIKATKMSCYDPTQSAVSARRLRMYGFKKVGVEGNSVRYEREI